MACWAKMLREAVSRLAASSTFRVTLILGGGGFARRHRSRNCICCCSPAFLLDAAIGIEQQSLRNSIDDALRVLRKWDVDTRSALDLPHFAEKNIQHDSVDRVVSAIEETGFHLVGLLAEAVDTAFTLFKAVGIPWEDRSEGRP
jgi:predicted signal transduction protein with EAL and GGDEF domain